MEKLPPEILHNIFIKLDLQERLAYLTICRSWWRVLDKYSLFYNIKLLKEGDEFDSMMDMFEQLPDRAAQVKELYIELNDEIPFDKCKLFSIFPNAHKVELRRDWALWRSTSIPTKSIDLTHFESKIEFLADLDNCELVSQMLYSNLGGRLKELELDFTGSPDKSVIVSQLKNLPVLIKLTLWSPNIEYCDLEHLHEHIPSIHDLRFGCLHKIDGDLPLNIQPATSITKLYFNYRHSKNTDKHARLYQYLAKKYTNLTDFDYKDELLPNYGSGYVKEVYLDALVDFYKAIGPTQKKLNFYGLPNDVNIFESLDAVGSRIKEMYFYQCDNEKLLEHLSQSNQSRYIETLNILCIKIESIHLINTMSVLTTFSLSIKPNVHFQLDMNIVLAACPPSLKNLEFRCHKLETKPSQLELNSIESLYIETHILTSDLSDIVSSCFPNLINLNLVGEVKESVNITLKSPHLQKAKFFTLDRFSVNSRDQAFSFTSPAQTETEYYIRSRKLLMGEMGGAKRVNYEDIQDLPTLSVVSLSGKKLKFGHFIDVVSC